MDSLREPRSKVNGKILPQFNGKPITILGKIKQVHPNGSSFEMETTDKMQINGIMPDPLTEPLEGWVEIRGEGQGKCHVTVHHYLALRPDIMNTFDAELYDDLVSTINSCDNPYI